MAITTLDGALAGFQPPWAFAKAATPTLVAGRPHSLWYLAGAPGVGLTPANTAGGVALSSSTTFANNINGQIPHQDPGSGNAYLGRFTGTASQPGTLLLCDRLMQIGGTSGGSAISPTTTGSQTITSGTLPARDNAGITSGAGVLAALEVVSVTGAGAGATPSLGYTNSGAAGSKTAPLVDPYVAASAAGAFYRFGLQAGDQGISQINTLTLGATMTSGTIALILYRELLALPISAANVSAVEDALTSGFAQLFSGVVPFLVFIPSTTTAANISGSYTETQG